MSRSTGLPELYGRHRRGGCRFLTRMFAGQRK